MSCVNSPWPFLQFGPKDESWFSTMWVNSQHSSSWILSPLPDIWQPIHPDYSDITLDPNTANPYLSFSDGRREVTTRFEAQPYPDHPARFTSWAQVLCCAGMAGRCYWEVEWSGAGGVSIGICYKNMSRCGGGSDSKLGHNSKSWSLDCSYTSCLFQHNKESVAVTTPCSSRVGVYLDFRAGTLSFYNVSSAMVLLHKVQATFSQPVYPGFWVGLGSSLKLCRL